MQFGLSKNSQEEKICSGTREFKLQSCYRKNPYYEAATYKTPSNVSKSLIIMKSEARAQFLLTTIIPTSLKCPCMVMANILPILPTLTNKWCQIKWWCHQTCTTCQICRIYLIFQTCQIWEGWEVWVRQVWCHPHHTIRICPQCTTPTQCSLPSTTPMKRRKSKSLRF